MGASAERSSKMSMGPIPAEEPEEERRQPCAHGSNETTRLRRVGIKAEVDERSAHLPSRCRRLSNVG